MSSGVGTRARPIPVPPPAAEVDTRGHGHAEPTDQPAAPQLLGGVKRIWRDRLVLRSLVIADLVALALSVVALSELASRSLQLLVACLFGAPVMVVAARVFGLYDRDEALLRKSTLDEAPNLFQVATVSTLSMWLAGGLVVEASFGRGEALLLWLLLATLLPFTRVAGRTLALAAAPVERCLFIGDAATAKTIGSKLCDDLGLKADLIAVIDPAEASRWSTDAASSKRLLEISKLTRSLDLQRAIIASDSVEPSQMLDLLCTLQAVGVKVSVLPRLLEVIGPSVEFDDLHGVTLMGVKRFALRPSKTKVKRAFDLAAASLGLLAVAPLMIAIAIAIRLDGPGPVFFRQRRVGRNGEHFELFKFRTMVPEAEAMKESLRDRNEAQEGLFKIADDPRVTRIGKLLRKTSLDELPQLFNVVRGEMSLVGPRPLVVDEDRNVTGWYRRRLELMPGITGPWQILGPARVPLREMGAIDYLYVANWSLWADLKILVRTVSHVLARQGL